jgi:hypothetical protein
MLEDIREFFKEFGKLLSKPVFGATPTEELSMLCVIYT